MVHIVARGPRRSSSTTACSSVVPEHRKGCNSGWCSRLRRGTPSPARAPMPRPAAKGRLNAARRRSCRRGRGGDGARARLAHPRDSLLLVLSTDYRLDQGVLAPCAPLACPMRALLAHPPACSGAHRPTRARRRRIGREAAAGGLRRLAAQASCVAGLRLRGALGAPTPPSWLSAPQAVRGARRGRRLAPPCFCAPQAVRSARRSAWRGWRPHGRARARACECHARGCPRGGWWLRGPDAYPN